MNNQASSRPGEPQEYTDFIDAQNYGSEQRIERKDKYHIAVDGVFIIAKEEQESRIRQLNNEQLTNFRKIMGGN